jgi:hypothetical protein
MESILIIILTVSKGIEKEENGLQVTHTLGWDLFVHLSLLPTS